MTPPSDSWAASLSALLLRAPTRAQLPELAAVAAAASHHDGVPQLDSLAALQHALDHPGELRQKDVLACVVVDDVVVGFHRLGSFEQPDGLQVYIHRGQVLPHWRGRGVGTLQLQRAEACLAELAHRSTAATAKTYGTWYYDEESEAADLLLQHNYRPHRVMLEMVRPHLDGIPEAPLPPGLALRPVQPGHMRAIWEAYVEASADDLGAVAGTQAGYEAWLGMPQWEPALWRVAWDGDQVAGMVLNHRPMATATGTTRRGYTEYVNVGRPWRRQGLARALLVASLHQHRELDMTEVALDVHEANPSGAPRLYHALGYRISRRLTVVRKPLGLRDRP